MSDQNQEHVADFIKTATTAHARAVAAHIEHLEVKVRYLEKELEEARKPAPLTVVPMPKRPYEPPAIKRSEPLSAFVSEVQRAINVNSMENGSNTPDFILAAYLAGCLDVFNDAVRAREKWYGKEDSPGSTP